MKNKFLPILLLSILTPFVITSCSKDEIDIDNSIHNTSSNNQIPKTQDNKVVQPIYNSSTLNHEDNSGWATFLTQKIESEFWVAFAYFDYNQDGEYDVFFREWNTNRIGVNIKTNDGWKDVGDVVNYQPNKMYRKIVPADVDNDGDIDMIAFNAEDPYDGNGNRIMGGIDLFRFDDGEFTYEVIESYGEGMFKFHHAGVVGDVNNDGWVDIIGSGMSGGKVYLNNNGSFSNDSFEVTEMTLDTPIHGTSPAGLELIDLNNDGYLDLLLGVVHNNFFYPHSPSSEHPNYNRTDYIYFGKSEYPYFESESVRLESEAQLKTEFDNPATYDWTFIDYNNDGFLDIVSLKVTENDTYGNFLEFFYNNGDGSFTLDNSIFSNNSNLVPNSRGTSFIKSYDVDGDGREEILVETSDWLGFNAWKQNGQGKYQKVTINY